MLCFLLIYRREIGEKNNLHILINCLYKYTWKGESLEQLWKVKRSISIRFKVILIIYRLNLLFQVLLNAQEKTLDTFYEVVR